MTFSTVMTFLCVAYILIYAGMIMYDMFLAKEAVDLSPRIEEEEIDISEEAMAFKPTEIGKIHKEWEGVTESSPKAQRQITMSNGIETDNLVPMMEDLAELGQDSPLGGMIQDWSEHDMAA